MPEYSDHVKIALVTGYLGAGKTTLLNHILRNDRGLRAAVIVNDIGAVNIDADLIREGGATKVEDVIPLTNGCICCTLADDLADQLAGIADSGDFDYVIIEASGICEPMPIAYTISEFCDERATDGAAPLVLDNIIAVVDCARLLEEFDGGRRLLAEDLEEDDVESLLVEQLEFCTTIVLNKTDLVSAEELKEIHAIVRSLQTSAVIIEAVDGEVPLDELLGTGRFDFDKVYQSAAWLDLMVNPDDHGDPEMLEYGMTTFVYARRKPFDLDRFAEFAANWPDSIIRTKGMTWFAQQPDECFLLEQSGSQREFTDNGPFIASLPEEEQTRVLSDNPGIMARWDSTCGDRQIVIVFIGRNMDRHAIEEALDACLVDWEG